MRSKYILGLLTAGLSVVALASGCGDDVSGEDEGSGASGNAGGGSSNSSTGAGNATTTGTTGPTTSASTGAGGMDTNVDCASGDAVEIGAFQEAGGDLLPWEEDEDFF